MYVWVWMWVNRPRVNPICDYSLATPLRAGRGSLRCIRSPKACRSLLSAYVFCVLCVCARVCMCVSCWVHPSIKHSCFGLRAHPNP